MKYFLQLCCSFFIFWISNNDLYAQGGTSSTSGAITITTANTIVNSHYPGTGSPAAGTSAISVGTIDGKGAGAVLAAGDLIVIMQMQGADINTANTIAYDEGNVSVLVNGYTDKYLFYLKYSLK